MARRPNVYCAGLCGGLLYGGTGSLPPGERTCNECRRNAREATCPVCSAAFTPRTVRNTYTTTCSRPCGQLFAARRRRELASST